MCLAGNILGHRTQELGNKTQKLGLSTQDQGTRSQCSKLRDVYTKGQVIQQIFEASTLYPEGQAKFESQM